MVQVTKPVYSEGTKRQVQNMSAKDSEEKVTKSV